MTLNRSKCPWITSPVYNTYQFRPAVLQTLDPYFRFQLYRNAEHKWPYILFWKSCFDKFWGFQAYAEQLRNCSLSSSFHSHIPFRCSSSECRGHLLHRAVPHQHPFPYWEKPEVVGLPSNDLSFFFGAPSARIEANVPVPVKQRLQHGTATL